mgnify:CR=1 FL=1
MKKRLPDFSSSKYWNSLRDKMGAKNTIELPGLDVGAITIREIQTLRTSSIDIDNILDHINPIDDTFEYKGQKVLLYIKEQHYDTYRFNGVITFKYHLVYCRTLKQMEAAGRFKKRYVVTQRTDGKFIVDIIDRITKTFYQENSLYRMDVCKNCLSKLSERYPHENIFNYYHYDLQKFIEKYNTNHIKLPPYSPSTLPKNDYPENWDKISRRLREEREYRCEKCGVDHSDMKNKIHVHHIDGYKYNNKSENLKVLCIDCHGNEPGHQKLGYSINNKIGTE